MTLTLTRRQKKLLEFVKACHHGQKRKYTFEPYWHHLVNVATLVGHYAPEAETGVETGLCHDLLEDTACDGDGLYNFLVVNGYKKSEAEDILKDVHSLTDRFTWEQYPHLVRSIRKSMEAKRLLEEAGDQAKTVKYADIIDNLSTLADRDPEFAVVYRSEKEMYLPEMIGGNCTLYRKALDLVRPPLKPTSDE